MLLPGTPLHDEFKRGEFHLLNEREIQVELREMIAHTHLSRGMFFANHACNYLPIKARLPRGKEEALAQIDSALAGDIDFRPEWSRAL